MNFDNDCIRDRSQQSRERRWSFRKWGKRWRVPDWLMHNLSRIWFGKVDR